MATVLCYAGGTADAKLHLGCEGGATRRHPLQDTWARVPLFIIRCQLYLMNPTCGIKLRMQLLG